MVTIDLFVEVQSQHGDGPTANIEAFNLATYLRTYLQSLGYTNISIKGTYPVGDVPGVPFSFALSTSRRLTE